MTVHDEFADDLALYALGILQGPDRGTLEAHLVGCEGCRRELEQLRGDAARLALSVPASSAPRRSRQRLMNAIASEPRRRATRSRQLVWWVPALTAAALALIAVFVTYQNITLRQQLADLRQLSAGQRAELEQARNLAATLAASETMRVTLVSMNAVPQPQGKAFYRRNTGTLVFLATNLPALPPGKAYELWLIPISGAPIPAGVFKPDTTGDATVINPPLAKGAQAKAFAVTIETETGSTAPTSAPIMVGQSG
jgi:anti-sigma-K factor RskA